METAFGRALIDSIEGPPQRFRMTVVPDGPSQLLECREHIELAPYERDALDALELPEDGVALDYGCGVGRHFAHLRRRHPDLHCCGVDRCDLMLTYCWQNIPGPTTFASRLEDLKHREFDLIMLLGNGLGILGKEADAKAGLARLVGMLKPKGKLLVESCASPFGERGHAVREFRIQYREFEDPPLLWGYADEAWVEREVEALGLRVTLTRGCRGPLFLALGEK